MRGKEKFGAKCIDLKKGGRGHGFMIFDLWWGCLNGVFKTTFILGFYYY